MNNINRKLRQLKKRKEVGLMSHVVLGYPNMTLTEKLVKTLIVSGSDFIELQIPFSDPIADGPTIMHACDVALKHQATPENAIRLMQIISKKSNTPLFLMAYYNTLFRYGLERFCQKAYRAGVSGVIIPDIPPEEEKYEHFSRITIRNNLYPIRVVSPASTDKRLFVNAKNATGFVYCVSRFGTTGIQKKMPVYLETYLSRVRQAFSIPLAVGFGISHPYQVKLISRLAEIIVVGSSIIKTMEMSRWDLKAVHNYICELKKAC